MSSAVFHIHAHATLQQFYCCVREGRGAGINKWSFFTIVLQMSDAEDFRFTTYNLIGENYYLIFLPTGPSDSHPPECVTPGGVLIQIGPPDDEHLLLETCRGVKINTLRKSASSWSLTRIHFPTLLIGQKPDKKRAFPE